MPVESCPDLISQELGARVNDPVVFFGELKVWFNCS